MNTDDRFLRAWRLDPFNISLLQQHLSMLERNDLLLTIEEACEFDSCRWKLSESDVPLKSLDDIRRRCQAIAIKYCDEKPSKNIELWMDIIEYYKGRVLTPTALFIVAAIGMNHGASIREVYESFANFGAPELLQETVLESLDTHDFRSPILHLSSPQKNYIISYSYFLNYVIRESRTMISRLQSIDLLCDSEVMPSFVMEEILAYIYEASVARSSETVYSCVNYFDECNIILPSTLPIFMERLRKSLHSGDWMVFSLISRYAMKFGKNRIIEYSDIFNEGIFSIEPEIAKSSGRILDFLNFDARDTFLKLRSEILNGHNTVDEESRLFWKIGYIIPSTPSAVQFIKDYVEKADYNDRSRSTILSSCIYSMGKFAPLFVSSLPRLQEIHEKSRLEDVAYAIRMTIPVIKDAIDRISRSES